jgi:uncharacterized protein YcbK (DUF882 family)
MSYQTFVNATEAMKLIREKRIETLRQSRVSKHFTWGEMLIYRTPRNLESIQLAHLVNLVRVAERLEIVREQLDNRPIFITSGWRDALTNRVVGGARASQHLLGRAVDIVVSGLTPKQVQDALDDTWEGGLGYGATFTHLDIRGFRARFNY